MKNLYFFSAILFILNFNLSGQEKEISLVPEKVINKGMAFGFQVGQYQKDFAFGLNVTSAYFAAGSCAVRLRANVAFNEHEMAETGDITWTPYSHLSLGFTGSGGMAAQRIRLY